MNNNYFDLDENFERKIRTAKDLIDQMLSQEAQNVNELYIGYMSIGTSLVTTGVSFIANPEARASAMKCVTDTVLKTIEQQPQIYESNEHT